MDLPLPPMDEESQDCDAMDKYKDTLEKRESLVESHSSKVDIPPLDLVNMDESQEPRPGDLPNLCTELKGLNIEQTRSAISFEENVSSCTMENGKDDKLNKAQECENSVNGDTSAAAVSVEQNKDDKDNDVSVKTPCVENTGSDSKNMNGSCSAHEDNAATATPDTPRATRTEDTTDATPTSNYKSPMKPMRRSIQLPDRTAVDTSIYDEPLNLDDSVQNDSMSELSCMPKTLPGFLPKFDKTSTPATQRTKHAMADIVTPQKEPGLCDFSVVSPMSPMEEDHKPMPPPRKESLLDQSLGMQEGSYVGKCRHKDSHELG